MLLFSPSFALGTPLLSPYIGAVLFNPLIHIWGPMKFVSLYQRDRYENYSNYARRSEWGSSYFFLPPLHTQNSSMAGDNCCTLYVLWETHWNQSFYIQIPQMCTFYTHTHSQYNFPLHWNILPQTCFAHWFHMKAQKPPGSFTVTLPHKHEHTPGKENINHLTRSAGFAFSDSWSVADGCHAALIELSL